MIFYRCLSPLDKGRYKSVFTEQERGNKLILHGRKLSYNNLNLKLFSGSILFPCSLILTSIR